MNAPAFICNLHLKKRRAKAEVSCFFPYFNDKTRKGGEMSLGVPCDGLVYTPEH